MNTPLTIILLFGAAMLLGAAAPESEVAVFVLVHGVEPQDQLTARDLVEAQMALATARGALGLRDIAGMEATRRLAAGSVVRATDIVRPQLVRRGEPVTITIRHGALVISTAGRALGSGAAGAGVRVVATSTNRTLDGVVDGPGIVRVIAN